MKACNQLCPWNTLYGCIKPESEPCILSNVACEKFEPKPQTNADHIRSMTGEELAVFLECFTVCHYCSEYEEASFVENGIPDCDGDCKQHLSDWLKQPYAEEIK